MLHIMGNSNTKVTNINYVSIRQVHIKIKNILGTYKQLSISFAVFKTYE